MSDAAAAAAVLALDPVGVGGVALRAGAGPVREWWLGLMRGMVKGVVRKVPLGISEERLLGMDLAATLAAGAMRRVRGVLVEADGGVVVLAMAERVGAGTAARVAQVMDAGAVENEAARFGVVLLDEGIEEERPAGCLMERMGIWLELGEIGEGQVLLDLEEARGLLPGVTAGDEALEALCGAAVALGVWSGRATVLAMRVARAAAALAGRGEVGPDDVALAARLVLAPRATRVPEAGQEEAEDEWQDEAPPPEQEASEGDTEPTEGKAMADQVIEAARAAIPVGLLAMLQQAGGPKRPPRAGRVGAMVRGARGRPVGSRAGMPRDGLRLDLMATLRAAAPWQQIRGGAPPVRLRRDDLQVSRRAQRAETTTIFLVDASGSLAFNRLAEAKGAVELLLADCYVRRDQVAVVAFRGKTASVMLPPTRSLVRAKRGLAGLPGGGGTPLAAGIEAGVLLADGVRRRGGRPTLVLLTDGRANVGRDGRGGRVQAQADAVAAARMVRAAGHAALFIDTSPRANPVSRDLAAAMGARYLALPYADAVAVSRSVRGLAGGVA